MHRKSQLNKIRFWLTLFMAGLVLSGVTAFPLETELQGVVQIVQNSPLRSLAEHTHLLPWLQRVLQGLSETNRRYPFLAYGTDWLAFAHLVIAMVFLGPYRDPVRNEGCSRSACSPAPPFPPWRSLQARSAASRSDGASSIAALA